MVKSIEKYLLKKARNRILNNELRRHKKRKPSEILFFFSRK